MLWLNHQLSACGETAHWLLIDFSSSDCSFEALLISRGFSRWTSSQWSTWTLRFVRSSKESLVKTLYNQSVDCVLMLKRTHLIPCDNHTVIVALDEVRKRLFSCLQFLPNFHDFHDFNEHTRWTKLNSLSHFSIDQIAFLYILLIRFVDCPLYSLFLVVSSRKFLHSNSSRELYQRPFKWHPISRLPIWIRFYAWTGEWQSMEWQRMEENGREWQRIAKSDRETLEVHSEIGATKCKSPFA